MALAVGPDIDYVEVKVRTEILVLAKFRLSIIKEEYEIIAEHKGSEMVGIQYEPLFPYLEKTISESEKPKLEKAFKVYNADFVTRRRYGYSTYCGDVRNGRFRFRKSSRFTKASSSKSRR